VNRNERRVKQIMDSTRSPPRMMDMSEPSPIGRPLEENDRDYDECPNECEEELEVNNTSLQRNYQHKARNPKPFRGVTGEWTDYRIYFERLVRWNGWTPEEALDALLLALEDDAGTYVNSLPNYSTIKLNQLYIALEKRFGTERTSAEDRMTLSKRTKQPTETYEHLAQDIARLANRVFQHSEFYAQREAREAFLKALPVDIRGPIMASNPKTLNDCVQNVVNYESLLGRSGSHKVRQVMIDQPSLDCFQMGAGDNGCFGCGSFNHFLKDCPTRQNGNNFQQRGRGRGDYNQARGIRGTRKRLSN